jgi:transposase
MLALHPTVVDAVWTTIEAPVPDQPPDTHPLGCHRRRVPDRVCFEGILVRLVTGCSWDVAARIVHVGETTLRRRRDQWVRARRFGVLAREALEAYDRVIGKNPTDRGRLGWKWSLATDRNGIPIAWAAEAANRHDSQLLEETLSILDFRGYEVELATVHLDRGYDFTLVRDLLAESGIEAVIPLRRKPKPRQRRTKSTVSHGQRWRVERANSWLTNFGARRRTPSANSFTAQPPSTSPSRSSSPPSSSSGASATAPSRRRGVNLLARALTRMRWSATR